MVHSRGYAWQTGSRAFPNPSLVHARPRHAARKRDDQARKVSIPRGDARRATVTYLRLEGHPAQRWLMSEVGEGIVKEPRNRHMPLTAAMVRFVDVAELIKSRSITDEV